MENIRYFLESSTIHGLNYISASRSYYVRIFWTIAVISGFIGAGTLINESFQAWDESPIKTTIETLPITEMTFPKVTVCPPRNTYTNLNYDLMRTDNMTLDNETIQDLTSYALELLNDELFNIKWRNMSKIQENDRFLHWYQGITEIRLPYFEGDTNQVTYKINTCATSGTIYTQYFGKKFYAKLVDFYFDYMIRVHPPDSVSYDNNVSLHFDVDKISLEELSGGKDNVFVDDMNIYLEENNLSTNFSPPSPSGSYRDLGMSSKLSSVFIL